MVTYFFIKCPQKSGERVWGLRKCEKFGFLKYNTYNHKIWVDKNNNNKMIIYPRGGLSQHMQDDANLTFLHLHISENIFCI